jgi:hypothetical protein
MLNNERKFPKREPVWKPLFDILFAVSLFPSERIHAPAKPAYAELTLDVHPSPTGKICLESAIRIIRVGPLHTNALRALAETQPYLTTQLGSKKMLQRKSL